MTNLYQLLSASALLAATAGCAANAPAQTAAAPGVCSTYGLVDLNNDGVVTQAEWLGFRSSTFADWDFDDDNLIGRSEFRNCWAAGGFRNDADFQVADWEAHFLAFDANRDGLLAPGEYFGDPVFATLDRDNDMRIETTLNEWTLLALTRPGVAN